MGTKSNTKKRHKSDFLFPKMTSLVGAGSVLNIAGNYFEFNSSRNADLNALRSDWESVGNDISTSLDSILTS